ncbi:hypothetical protein [Listeria booriae]|uniref:hypothetical protein n=1 Tax=Listeria booriae TaxID=1552123 RepID=UPI0016287642|nr:hypothetical protein [Listeria booriae]MBC2196280.1 hypothetical protein [Listeria booriae]
MDKIIATLKNSNFIDEHTLHLLSISEADIELFCEKYKLTWEVKGSGNWLWVQFKKNGELVEQFDELLKGGD